MFNVYLEKISTTNQIENLKELAKEIFESKEILERQKSILFKAYKEKLRVLQGEFIRNTNNELFKVLYYTIIKAPVPEVGKLLHLLKDQFNPVERDILFTTYERRKIVSDIARTEKESAQNTIEPF